MKAKGRRRGRIFRAPQCPTTQSLRSFLRTKAPSCISSVKLSSLRGKVVGIDANLYVHKWMVSSSTTVANLFSCTCTLLSAFHCWKGLGNTAFEPAKLTFWLMCTPHSSFCPIPGQDRIIELRDGYAWYRVHVQPSHNLSVVKTGLSLVTYL